MKRPRLPLPPREPCPVCDRAPGAATRTPAEVTADVKVHNLLCARWGERSYGRAIGLAARTVRLMQVAAVLTLAVGCAEPYAGPRRCAPGQRADTVYTDSLTTVIVCRGWR